MATQANDWNLLAVARPRAPERTLRALCRFAPFRGSGYPRVLVGRAPRTSAAQELVARVGADQQLGASLFRMVELERSLPFSRYELTETLCDEFEGLGSRLAGRSFYVRANLRGLKGRLQTPAVERALGAFLLDRAETFGAPARVCFDGPELVVAVEVVGSRVGYVLLDREARSLPLLRVR